QQRFAVQVQLQEQVQEFFFLRKRKQQWFLGTTTKMQDPLPTRQPAFCLQQKNGSTSAPRGICQQIKTLLISNSSKDLAIPPPFFFGLFHTTEILCIEYAFFCSRSFYC
ncbi:unnamed protein product, partial [Heterosigma akashiwo]